MLASLTDKSDYSSHFMDVSLWEPFVSRVCLQHGFACRNVQPGVPGTYPTFIVELDPARSQPSVRSVVVKFFGPLFNGADSFRVERALGHWLEQQSLPVRSPAILSEGELDPDWCYLIFEHIPGVPIGQVSDKLSAEDWAGVAKLLGEYLRQLHKVSSSLILALSPTPAILPS
jgi:hypothetical protein